MFPTFWDTRLWRTFFSNTVRSRNLNYICYKRERTTVSSTWRVENLKVTASHDANSVSPLWNADGRLKNEKRSLEVFFTPHFRRRFSIPVRHCFSHFPLATIGGPLSALQIDIYERCRTKGSEPGGDECDKFYYADFNGQLRDSDVGFYSAIVNGPPTVALSATCSTDQSMIKLDSPVRSLRLFCFIGVIMHVTCRLWGLSAKHLGLGKLIGFVLVGEFLLGNYSTTFIDWAKSFVYILNIVFFL